MTINTQQKLKLNPKHQIDQIDQSLKSNDFDDSPDDEEMDFNLIKNKSTGRSRISQACDRCRIKKVKCDGKLPQCSNCKLINFNCKISDKLTRNSFPKGYTKNLERQLINLEFEKNNLTIELENLKRQKGLLSTSNSSTNITLSNTPVDSSSNNNNNFNSSSNNNSHPHSHSHSHIRSTNHKNLLKLKVNSQGIIILNQFIKRPLNLFFDMVNLNTFNGYESTNKLIDLNTSSNSSLKQEELNILNNYHMNLNRYLNLIFYKLIYPLISFDQHKSNTGIKEEDLLEHNHNHRHHHQQPHINSIKNLDQLIWNFFNNYNTLLNILNFDILYNDYLKFKVKYNNRTSNYFDPITGELKKKYHNFNSREQDLLVKLILILKFTLNHYPSSAAKNSPSDSPNNLNSAVNFLFPLKQSINQFDDAIKIINLTNLKMCFKNINFQINPTVEKLENCLLFIYYFLNFENNDLLINKFYKNTSTSSSSIASNDSILMNIIQISSNLIKTLNLHKNGKLLDFQTDNDETKNEKQDVNYQKLSIHRIKLFWNYKILVKWFKISYSFKLPNDQSSSFDDMFEFNQDIQDWPDSLHSIKLLDSDVIFSLKLYELFRALPVDLLELITMDYEDFDNPNKLNHQLLMIDMKLTHWFNKYHSSDAYRSSKTKSKSSSAKPERAVKQKDGVDEGSAEEDEVAVEEEEENPENEDEEEEEEEEEEEDEDEDEDDNNNKLIEFQLSSVYYFYKILINLKFINDDCNSIENRLRLFNLSKDFIELSYDTLINYSNSVSTTLTGASNGNDSSSTRSSSAGLSSTSTSSHHNHHRHHINMANLSDSFNEFFYFAKILQLVSIICLGKLGSNAKVQEKVQQQLEETNSTTTTKELFEDLNTKVLQLLKVYNYSINNYKISDHSIVSIVKYIKEKLDLNSTPSPIATDLGVHNNIASKIADPNNAPLDPNSSKSAKPQSTATLAKFNVSQDSVSNMSMDCQSQNSSLLDNEDELNDLFSYKSTVPPNPLNSNSIDYNDSGFNYNHHLNSTLFESNIFDNQSSIYDPMAAFNKPSSAASGAATSAAMNGANASTRTNTNSNAVSSSLTEVGSSTSLSTSTIQGNSQSTLNMGMKLDMMKRGSMSSLVSNSNKRQMRSRSNSTSPTPSDLTSYSGSNSISLFPSASVSRAYSVSSGPPISSSPSSRKHSVPSAYPSLFSHGPHGLQNHRKSITSATASGSSTTNSTPVIRAKSSKKQRSLSLSNNHAHGAAIDANSLHTLKRELDPLFPLTETSPAVSSQIPMRITSSEYNMNSMNLNIHSHQHDNEEEMSSVQLDTFDNCSSTFDRISVQSNMTNDTSISGASGANMSSSIPAIAPPEFFPSSNSNMRKTTNAYELQLNPHGLKYGEVVHSTTEIINDFLNLPPSTTSKPEIEEDRQSQPRSPLSHEIDLNANDADVGLDLDKLDIDLDLVSGEITTEPSIGCDSEIDDIVMHDDNVGEKMGMIKNVEMKSLFASATGL